MNLLIKKGIFTYTRNLTFLTLIVGIIALLLFSTVLRSIYHQVFWFLLLFFYILFTTGHTILILGESKWKMNFSNAYMLSFSIKFIGYFVALLYYFLTHKENIIYFGLCLIILYLIYTVFEVRSNVVLSKRSVNKIEN